VAHKEHNVDTADGDGCEHEQSAKDVVVSQHNGKERGVVKNGIRRVRSTDLAKFCGGTLRINAMMILYMYMKIPEGDIEHVIRSDEVAVRARESSEACRCLW
jgi:hypothetical protein